MPDPIDELENFTDPRTDHEPAPRLRGTPSRHPDAPPQQRPRGDRRRRRRGDHRHAAGDGGQPATAPTPRPRRHQPQPRRSTWVQEIPADFPLTDGMPEGTQVRPTTAPAGLTVCDADAGSGRRPPPPGTVDSAGATAGGSGTDGGTEARTVYPVRRRGGRDRRHRRARGGRRGLRDRPERRAATPCSRRRERGALGGDASLVRHPAGAGAATACSTTSPRWRSCAPATRSYWSATPHQRRRPAGRRRRGGATGRPLGPGHRRHVTSSPPAR